MAIARGMSIHGRGHTSSNQRQRFFLDRLASDLGIKRQEDWYRVKVDDFTQREGKGFIEQYRNSIMDVLESTYSEFDWNPIHFHKLPVDYWHDAKKKRKVFDKLADELGVAVHSDWYSVDNTVVKEGHWSTILKQHNGSLRRALESVYPEFTWHLWFFSNGPKNFWNQKENRKKFFNWLGEELGISDLNEWYFVKRTDVVAKGGRGLLQYHKESFIKAIQSAFPEHNWKLWLFEDCPRRHWNNTESVKECLEWLGKKLSVKNLDDWHFINLKQFIQVGGWKLLQWGTLSQLLLICYPSHQWNSKLLVSRDDSTKEQMFLCKIVEDSLLPLLKNQQNSTLVAG